MEELVVKVDGKEYRVFVEETKEGKVLVHLGNAVYEVETKKDVAHSAVERLHKKQSIEEGEVEITAPLPGIIYDIKVKRGSNVKKGQTLFVLMAMKMENTIASPKDGTVKEIKVKKSQNVNRGDLLAVIK